MFHHVHRKEGRKEGKGEEGNGWVWKQETRVSVIKGCNEDLFTSTLQVSEVANILLVSSSARAECRVQQRRADSQFLVVKVFLLIHRCVVANIQNSHHTAKACVHHTGLYDLTAGRQPGSGRYKPLPTASCVDGRGVSQHETVSVEVQKNQDCRGLPHSRSLERRLGT